MNPAHGDYKNPRAYTVSGDVVVSDGTKVGCLTLTVTGTFELPTLTASQRVAFGVLTALAVYSEESFHVWGKNWLSGADRSAAAAYANAAANAAADARSAATNAAAHYANSAAYSANYAAAHAAYSANAYAAYAATAYYAASAAAHVANAAAANANAAAIDFEALAQEALK